MNKPSLEDHADRITLGEDTDDYVRLYLGEGDLVWLFSIFQRMRYSSWGSSLLFRMDYILIRKSEVFKILREFRKNDIVVSCSCKCMKP